MTNNQLDMKASSAAFVMDMSCFSMHTERLIEVLFERVHCNKFVDLSLTCSRFTADYRYPEKSFSFENNYSLENESIGYDEFDLYPAKHELSSKILGNKLELSNYDSDRIKTILKDLGFICEDDKMYTMQPSRIYWYQQIGFDHLSVIDRFYKSISLNLSSEKKCLIHNDIDENRNYYQVKSVSPQNNGYIYEENKYSPLNNSKKKSPYKYWLKRHMLFSKFDLGILLDEESLYSVCPEILSYHIAKRCKNDVALDPFCGAGGNIIQLAFTCKLVLAIDIDPNKIKLARHNAEIYGVADKIEFIVGDFFAISSMLKADVIYMSPPWGGPEYLDDNSFSIGSICKRKYYGGFGIFDIVKKIAPRIAFHMPKTTNIYECLWLANDFGKVETQQNIINGKFDSITAFYGEFTNSTDNDY